MNSPRIEREPGVRFAKGLVFLGAIWVLSGCHSLPDVQPFADATTKLRHTVASTGDTAVDQVGRVDRAQAKKLQDDWAKRNQLMEALDNYASALAAVVRAGQSGAETAKALGTAVQNLASSLNVAFPGGGAAASTGAQLASDLFVIAAREWAAHVLVQRLLELDPKIQAVTAVLAADLSDLKNIARAARNEALTKLATAPDLGNDLERVNTLKAKRVSASKGLPDVMDAQFSERLKLLQQINDALQMETKTPGYSDYLKNVGSVEKAFDDQRDILDQAVLLLHAWGDAHHQLLLAIQKKGAPSLQELVQIANDLQELYRQIRTNGGKP